MTAFKFIVYLILRTYLEIRIAMYHFLNIVTHLICFSLFDVRSFRFPDKTTYLFPYVVVHYRFIDLLAINSMDLYT